MELGEHCQECEIQAVCVCVASRTPEEGLVHGGQDSMEGSGSLDSVGLKASHRTQEDYCLSFPL